MALEWHGREAEQLVQRRAVAVLTKIAVTIKGEAQALLGVAGTGKVKGQAKRDNQGRFLKAAVRVERSRPGEPPRKQTGQLRRSVQSEVDPGTLRARVGTNVEYGKHLELGTKRGLDPRPWLRPAWLNSMARVNAWLATLGDSE